MKGGVFESLGKAKLSEGGEYIALSYDWSEEKKNSANDQAAQQEKKVGEDSKSRLVLASTERGSGSCEGSLPSGHVSYLYISRGNPTVATASWDGNVTLWTSNCRYITNIYSTNYFMYGAAISDNGKIVAGSSFGSLRTWTLFDNKPSSWDGALLTTSTCEHLQFDPRNVYLACGTRDGDLIIADAGENKVLHWIAPSGSSINAIAFSSTGELAVSNKEGDVIVYTAGDGKVAAKARLLAVDEWIVFDGAGHYCGTPDSEKYLRVDRVKPGLIWDSHETAFLAEEDKTAFRLNCAADEKDKAAQRNAK